ncbi:unnamed protein product [Chironomus riparius]|uniref:BTB domain-containing protein n=1 Tax=Chironomus riparius TaxID=315576 RepID=A0A9N9RLQ3_9DIPT|nr:unnamed protein product [Chironomus riparius]
MEIKCRFGELPFKHGEKLYCCSIESQLIRQNSELNFIGDHEPRKTNDDVHGIEFSECTVAKVPAGLTMSFPNLKMLAIKNSRLEKICKDDLIEYKNLEKLICFQNKIEYLPGDLFEGFEHLEWIEFWENKLGIIEPNIFDELDNLKYLDIEGNPDFDKWYSCYPSYNRSTSLEEIKDQICTRFLSNDQKTIKTFLKKVKDPIDMLKIFSEKSHNFAMKSTVLKVTFDILEETVESSKAEKLEMQIQFQQQIEEMNRKLKTGLMGNIKNFINDETTKDFKVQVDEKEFNVHKFLLAARSPVLAETFKNNPEVENLNLIDISVDIFEQILNFIYTDELPDENTNFLHLFASAGKLKIEELKNFAATMLLEQITSENSFDIFKLSNKYNHNELRIKAFNKIRSKYPKIKFNVNWEDDPEKVEVIVEKFRKKEEAIKKLEDEIQMIEEDFENELTSFN